MEQYKSLRNGQTATLLAHNKNGVLLQLETGEEKIIAESTLKRWWKLLENESLGMETPTQEQPITRVTPTEDNDFYSQMLLSEKQLESPLITDVFNLFHKIAEVNQTQLQPYPTTKGFYTLKHKGKIYMAFTASSKSVTLWLKDKAVGQVAKSTYVNHSFDTRLNITQWNTDVYKQITELHDKSLRYHVNKLAK